MPISDNEFASVKEGFASNSIVTGLIVLLILWLALRSWRLVLAVGITLAAGSVITAGLGFLFVGALNPISIAFAVLFVGLGADFAVQFNLRYRAQRYLSHDLRQALVEAADRVGIPLHLLRQPRLSAFYRSHLPLTRVLPNLEKSPDAE